MKKLLLSLALALIAFTANAQSHILSDADGDGRITTTDVTMIVDYIMGQHNSNFIAANADVNRDGKITIIDVTKTVNNILTGSGGGWAVPRHSPTQTNTFNTANDTHQPKARRQKAKSKRLACM